MNSVWSNFIKKWRKICLHLLRLLQNVNVSYFLSFCCGFLFLDTMIKILRDFSCWFRFLVKSIRDKNRSLSMNQIETTGCYLGENYLKILCFDSTLHTTNEAVNMVVGVGLTQDEEGWQTHCSADRHLQNPRCHLGYKEPIFDDVRHLSLAARCPRDDWVDLKEWCFGHLALLWDYELQSLKRQWLHIIAHVQIHLVPRK